MAPPSDCHADFTAAINCSFEATKGFTPADAAQVEHCFTSMRTDLLRIITSWEASGQGEGGMIVDDEVMDQDSVEEADEQSVDHKDEDSASFVSCNSTSAGRCRRRRQNISTTMTRSGRPTTMLGSLSGRSAGALQTRAAFLNSSPSYLLYFWEIADAIRSCSHLSSNLPAAMLVHLMHVWS